MPRYPRSRETIEINRLFVWLEFDPDSFLGGIRQLSKPSSRSDFGGLPATTWPGAQSSNECNCHPTCIIGTPSYLKTKSSPIGGTSLLTSAFMSGIRSVGNPAAPNQLNTLHPSGAVHREMNRPYGRLDAQTGGVATVTKGRVRAHGECSCGWKGSGHVLSAVAIHDALIHAAVQRCQPGVPLVF